jgi:hypothetical protein
MVSPACALPVLKNYEILDLDATDEPSTSITAMTPTLAGRGIGDHIRDRAREVL